MAEKIYLPLNLKADGRKKVRVNVPPLRVPQYGLTPEEEAARQAYLQETETQFRPPPLAPIPGQAHYPSTARYNPDIPSTASAPSLLERLRGIFQRRPSPLAGPMARPIEGPSVLPQVPSAALEMGKGLISPFVPPAIGKRMGIQPIEWEKEPTLMGALSAIPPAAFVGAEMSAITRGVKPFLRASRRAMTEQRGMLGRSEPEWQAVRNLDDDILKLNKARKDVKEVGGDIASIDKTLAEMESYRESLLQAALQEKWPEYQALQKELYEATEGLKAWKETYAPAPKFGTSAADEAELLRKQRAWSGKKPAVSKDKAMTALESRIQGIKEQIAELEQGASKELPIAKPQIGFVQKGMGIGEKPPQGALFENLRGEGQGVPLADAEQIAARQARKEIIAQGQAELPKPVAPVAPEVTRVYHGTEMEFPTFDISQSKKWNKFALWFTDNKEAASAWGKNIKAADIKLNNPKTLTDREWYNIQMAHAKDAEWFTHWKTELRKQGFDGLKIEQVGLKGEKRGNIWAVFDNEKVQSPITESVSAAHPVTPVLKPAPTIPAPVVKPGAKEPWQMTYQEYDTVGRKLYESLGNELYVNSKYHRASENVPHKLFGESQALFPGSSSRQAHYRVIKQALSEGKPVPPEVLKDYPDLLPSAKAAGAVGKVQAVKPPSLAQPVAVPPSVKPVVAPPPQAQLTAPAGIKPEAVVPSGKPPVAETPPVSPSAPPAGAPPVPPPPTKPPVQPPPSVGGVPPVSPMRSDAELIEGMIQAIKETRPMTQREIQKFYHEVRAKKFAIGTKALQTKIGAEARSQAFGALKGELPKPQFHPIGEKAFTPVEFERLHGMIQDKFKDNVYLWAPTETGFAKLFTQGVMPSQSELRLLEEVFGSKFVQAVLNKRSGGRKAFELFLEVLNIPRSLLASGDLSDTFRQGGIMMPEGKSYLEARLAQFKSIKSEADAQAVLQQIKNHRLYHKLLQANLSLTNVWKAEGITGHEESFLAGRILKRFPLTRISERAYSTGLNKLRADVFYKYAEELERAKASQEAYGALAQNINILTGRGNLGKLTQLSSFLNAFFFAPRFAVSRFQVPYTFVANLSKFARNPNDAELRPIMKMLAKDVVGEAVAITTALTLLKVSGAADVETDPHSSDWGKIRIGQTRIDPWMGMQQPMRFIILLGTGSRKTIETGQLQKTDAKDVFATFLEGKLAPTSRLGLSLQRGEMFGGKKLMSSAVTVPEIAGQKISIPNIVWESISPIWIQDVVEAYQLEGGGQALGVAPLSFFGMGVSSFPSVPPAEWMPSEVTPERLSNLQGELKRLELQIGGVGWKIGEKELTQQEHALYNRLAGQKTYSALAELIETPYYTSLPDEGRQKVITALIIEAKARAREEMKQSLTLTPTRSPKYKLKPEYRNLVPAGAR